MHYGASDWDMGMDAPLLLRYQHVDKSVSGEPLEGLVEFLQVLFTIPVMFGWPILVCVSPIPLIGSAIRILWGPGDKILKRPPPLVISLQIWRTALLLSAFPLWFWSVLKLFSFPHTTLRQQKSKVVSMVAFYCAETFIIIFIFALAALFALLAVSLIRSKFSRLSKIVFPSSIWDVKIPLVLFPVFNLVIPLLCYAYVYEPAGTFKPSWVERLGR